MSDLLKRAYDPEKFRKQGHDMVNRLADYLAESLNRTDIPVYPYKEPDERYKDWDRDFNSPGEEGLSDFFDDTIRDSIHLHHPRYVGHQVTPPIPIAALSDMLSAMLNNGMAVYEMGAFSTAQEIVVMNELAKEIGMDASAGGMIVSGGSIGNLTALLSARQALQNSDIWIDGNNSERQLAIMVSENAHYCVERASKIMGLGDQGIIKVPVDDDLKMRVPALEKSLKNARDRNITMIAIVANAANTATGTFDPLDKIADFCRDEEIWFHIDGAHGGAAAISRKYNNLTKGIERADSVVIDFHKMMMMPALCTAVLFRKENDSYQTFAQKAPYLWGDNDDKQWYNVGKRTIECTKRMMSTKIYAMLRTYGFDLVREYVDTTFDLAAEFAELIYADKDFRIVSEPACNIVCFNYIDDFEDLHKSNAFVTSIREEVIKSGRFYISATLVGEEMCLRTTLMNPFTDKKDLLELLDLVREFARDEISKLEEVNLHT
jgi:L-2,4-diaminobutyrate decarboxylase